MFVLRLDFRKVNFEISAAKRYDHAQTPLSAWTRAVDHSRNLITVGNIIIR